jgi:hypothetical protein
VTSATTGSESGIGAEGSRRFGLAVCTVLVMLGLLPAASALAAEACPNEQLRRESRLNPATGEPYSAELPGCRAYELVSPPDTAGMPALLGDATAIIGSAFAGTGPQFLAGRDGSIFFESQATPAGTGAVADGGYVDVFRSRRTASGWVTRDMLPSAQPGYKGLLAASADGSSVLVETPLTLSLEDLDNPLAGTTVGRDMYVVHDNGAPPGFVTHGEIPNRVLGQTFVGTNPVANPELSAVGFQTEDSLAAPSQASEPTPGCYVWADAGPRLARLTNPEGPEPSRANNCRYLAIAADGRPIIEDTVEDSLSTHPEGLIFAADPGVNVFPNLGGTRQLSGNTPRAAKFDAMSPDAETVYLTTTDRLLENVDAGADIYGIDLQNAGLKNTGPPEPPAVSCISCDANGAANSGDATYVGVSADSSHVFFSVAGTVYEHDAAGTSELAPATYKLEQLSFSQNGQYSIATSSAPPLAPTGTVAIYELSPNMPPKLITSGNSSTHSYQRLSVSNDGQRVLYEDFPEGRPAVIDEWLAGQAGQVSPLGATQSYNVLAAEGPDLEDVLLAANAPLVTQDLNAGTTDIYDARVTGGFPARTEPPGDVQTPNPQAPSPPAYSRDLLTTSPQLAPLALDTSRLPGAAAPRTQLKRLLRAVKRCKKDRRKTRRARCDRAARKRPAGPATLLALADR